MITAEMLSTLTTFTTEALSRAVDRANTEFNTSKFLGITNGGQFCYQVRWEDQYGGAQGKVFLNYDPEAGTVNAVLG